MTVRLPRRRRQHPPGLTELECRALVAPLAQVDLLVKAPGPSDAGQDEPGGEEVNQPEREGEGN